MKILVLTRNLESEKNKSNGNGNQQNISSVPSQEITVNHNYGRENIGDALAIKKTLTQLNHEVKIIQLSEDSYAQIKAEKPDVVFNLCDDGFRGDYSLEPHVAIMLDILGVSYTGNNYFTIALCQNKARAKDILTYNNVLTPKFQVFTSAERKLNPELKFPMIVKPIREDGSVGIRERSVVNNEDQLKEEVDHIINLHKQEALVEELVDGREFNVSLIGNRRPMVLPVAEIDFTEMPGHLPRIVSYRAKWVRQSIVYQKTPVICPANIDEKTKKLIEETARKCYKIFGCTGYIRIDFRYDNEKEKLYALEVNPNPDISEDAGLVRAARTAGISYQDLLLKIIGFAMEKKNMKVLILTRNLEDYYEDGTIDRKSEELKKEENSFGYGRENIKDALGVKKVLNGSNEIKIISLNNDIYTQAKQENPDVIFNLCDDGFRGDTRLEPHVVAVFDILDISYTGNNYFTIALCQNKARAKDILTYNNVLTPKFQVFTSAERKLNPELKFPMIVKPIREDGSIGIRERSVVENEEQLKEEIDHIIKFYDQEALVEEFIDGREFTVSLIGNRRPIVLPVTEIDFTEMPKHLPKIISYRAKWVKQSIAYKKSPVICPANVDEKTKKLIEETARKCYKIFGCRGYARIDFRYDEKEKKLYVLEINPNPDISEEFETAKAALAAGMTYADLVMRIIGFALEK